jgi:hypothetical protein
MEYVFLVIALAIGVLLWKIYKELTWMGHVILIEFDKINDGIFTEYVCEDCAHE